MYLELQRHERRKTIAGVETHNIFGHGCVLRATLVSELEKGS